VNDRRFKVRALGEIAIRCADLPKMAEFYQYIIGLDLLSGSDDGEIVFFNIGPGFGGHTSVLALFRSEAGSPEIHEQSAGNLIASAQSSLHHIALSLPFSEQEAVMRWYELNDIKYNVQVFAWVGWRGIFTIDPEGNTVELVAYDDSLLQQQES